MVVQPCARRTFPMEEYIQAGARPSEGLDAANILVGIKETPLDELLTNEIDGKPRTHIMFSHTAKGQHYNMPLLAKFTQSSARLIDYELLTDSQGKRVVAFGWYAGAAGVPEALNALGLDYLSMGVSSPFLLLPRPYHHSSLEELRNSMRRIGSIISERGMPEATGPCIIALTGNGNVSQGALSLLQELPIKQIEARDLAKVATSPNTPRNFVYLIHVKPEDYLVDIRGDPYNRSTYYSRPELYVSLFYQRIAPYISLLINGTGWKPGFPRLLNNQQLAAAQRHAKRGGKLRFRSIADISCDIEGGLEFVSRAATISEPFFSARPSNHPDDLSGIQVMSVDILPSELPLDSSRHFSNKFLPYLQSLIKAEKGRPLEQKDLSNLDVLRRGTIVQDGKLLEPHNWLTERMMPIPIPTSTHTATSSTSNDSTRAKKRVLLLGSGMVAKPAVDHIAARPDVEIIVASNNIREARQLAAPHQNAKALLLDVSDQIKLGSLVQQSDIVISLLPMPLHATIAEHCVTHQTHMVTASYISPDMRKLDERAKESGVLLLNEIGLDPGIDHCSAVELCEDIRKMGRKPVSFLSVCGGLPVPEDSNVPLGYKFSWSPRGVLTAALNGAKFRLNSRNHEIKPGHLLKAVIKDIPLRTGLALECLPNRDSFSYSGTYGLEDPDKLESMFRGTLRYKGFSWLMDGFATSGVLDLTDPMNLNERGGWYSFLAQTLSRVTGIRVKNDKSEISSALKSLMTEHQAEALLEAAEWLSIVPPSSPASLDLPLVQSHPTLPLDLFARLLAHKLRYLPGEQDSVILSHEVISRPAMLQTDSRHDDDLVHTSTLILRQPDAERTAMAVTVSVPLAIAALRVLDGHVQTRGVVGPTADAAIYRSILQDMESSGITMKKETHPRSKGGSLTSRLMVP